MSFSADLALNALYIRNRLGLVIRRVELAVSIIIIRDQPGLVIQLIIFVQCLQVFIHQGQHFLIFRCFLGPFVIVIFCGRMTPGANHN